MTSKGRPAVVWKHYIVVFNGTNVKEGYKCKNCHTKVLATPEEAYRHLKNCSALSIDQKQHILETLPAEELKTYEKYWCSGVISLIGLIPQDNTDVISKREEQPHSRPNVYGIFYRIR